MHLGHAYSALFTWAAAAALGGEALLRIEDIDIARCKPEFDAAILTDLHWLELDWPEPVWRQSTRFRAYRDAASTLGDLLYPCVCTRAEIAARATATDPDGAPLYDGHCRDHGPASANIPQQWRLKMDEALARTGPLAIAELPVAGLALASHTPTHRDADPARWGDAVLVRKDTPTSYHLSVVVDDSAQGITHVTRGRDLYGATDLQVLLQALLGLKSPIYAHHDLVRDETAQKLSKSKAAPSLKSLREAGWTPAEIRLKLAALAAGDFAPALDPAGDPP